MTDEINYEKIIMKAIEEEKGNFEIVYYPLGKEEIDRINFLNKKGFLLPIKVISNKEKSLKYNVWLGKDKTLHIDYGTSSGVEDLEKIITFNEKIAVKLNCSSIHVEMLSEEIVDIYSKREYDYFSEGYTSFGYKKLK